MTAVGVATVGGPASASDSAPIAGSHAAWASAANQVSAANASQAVTFRVYLHMRDQAGAEAAARDVSSPGSVSFRKFLTTAQVKARYAPADSSVAAVRSWLRSSGFGIASVAANNLYVEATGTVAQAQHAFGVNLNMYRIKGKVLRAADRNLSVPVSVAGDIAGVIGVDNALNLLQPNIAGGGDDERISGAPPARAAASARSAAQPGVVDPPTGFRNSPPTSAYWGQNLDTTDPAYAGFPNPLPYAPTGYTPPQLRAAYGLSGLTSLGLDGRGTTVAIVDAFASPTLYQDAAEYARRNDPSHPLSTKQFKQIVFPPTPGLEAPNQCGAATWYIEQALDVEAVHAMAPGANILYVGGSDCQDLSLDKALNEIISKNLAQIVSNSYGSAGEAGIPPSEVRQFQAMAVQAVLEGIGVYFSSGDNGDEAGRLGSPSPDFSASNPWVTAVGGTSVGIDAKGRRVVETGWETGRSALVNGAWAPIAFRGGSGGGTSRLFAQPWYQRGVVPDALATQNQTGTAKGRVVPDISMVGDPNTGMLIGQTQTFPEGVQYGQFRIGGTSLSSPLFAGFVAVADQLLGHRHGFVNPVLYRFAAGTSAIKDVVHQANAVVRVDYNNGVDGSAGLTTSVRTFDYPGLTIHTTRGYDNVTGLGTPAGAGLLFVL